jgi:uncharacterized SAM-binding protein YcdF (DUF218 family)
MTARELEDILAGPVSLLIVIGLLIGWRIKHGKTGWLLKLSLGILVLNFIATISFAGYVIALPLKWWTPENSLEQADAIVVLGAYSQRTGAPTAGSAERSYLGSQVFLNGRAPMMLLTGYSSYDSLGSAKSMRIIALGMGVPDAYILMAGGRDSYDEARRGAAVLHKHNAQTIILVTSWYHIPRAKAVWEKQGFRVIPHSYFSKQELWDRLIDWYNITFLRLIFHEYVGMLVYWLRGWI